ncbi:heavy-metal-associated domain-containing protein [Nesterenkonia populi]|uniref:heavy-metal-associated domain-containing protein n=1 Tax=Nesterenkonia populi TaxID=1591087 RepID=UPI0011BECB52|nr:heavy-metal-associated domain-containing protein [Nesterenkonia populi]
MPTPQLYTVTGMSCAHCEAAVREELDELSGIAEVQISASSGQLQIAPEEGASVPDEAVLAAVEEAGYTAVRAA